jgi:hypothetical protein
MGRSERGPPSFQYQREALRFRSRCALGLCEAMHLRNFLSCLLAIWAFSGSSAPASFEPTRGYRHFTEPSAFKAEEPTQSLSNDPSKESSSTDTKPADEAKDSKPTSLERAKWALAESDAPALSDYEICETLIHVAKANDLPVGFFANLIWRESNFDHMAISRVGAMGIAQFMPDVADRLGLDAFDARDALPASGRLLRTLRARFGNLGLMAAAYNAGPKRVSDWLEQRSTLPKETRDYVIIITGRSVEHWRDVKSQTVVFNVPRKVPCHRGATFSEVEQAERAEQLSKLAEEKKLADAAREIARLQKKRKGRGTAVASSKGQDFCKIRADRRKLCPQRTATSG